MASAVGFLLEALSALSVGAAGGAMRRKASDEMQQQKLAGDAVMSLLQSGQDVPEALGKAAFGSKYKEIGPQLNFMTQAARKRKQDSINAMLQSFEGGGAQGAQVQPQAIPSESGPPSAVPALLRPQAGPAQVEPGITFAAGEQPSAAAPAPLQVPRLAPQRSLHIDASGQPSLTVTSPSTEAGIRTGIAVSAEERARRSEGRAEFRESQAESRTRTEFEQKQATKKKEEEAEKQIGALMAQSADLDDPKQKLRLLERSLSIAASAGLTKAEPVISAQIKNLRQPEKKEKLDLAKPNVAEYVASTGQDPVTGEPVDKAMQAQAQKFVADREQRIRGRVQAIEGLRTAELPKKVAITGAIRSLTKEGDAVNQFTVRAGQIEGALKMMESHLDVYPKTVAGRPAAVFADILQTDRGNVIGQIQQSINLLQSAEARFMANEVGRIPFQLEVQWRKVLADPTKVTQDRAKALIASTRARVKDMADARARAVRSRGATAERLGVPKEITRAFVDGDVEALRMTLDEGFSKNILPGTLSLDDVGEGQQVK